MNPSIFKLAITKPCLQDWEAMLPTEDGKYCLSCKKQVIDFSKMSDEEVQNYFSNNTNQSTCGRFYTNQLERIQIYLPKDILNKKIAVWKKYLVCLLICFGTQLFPVDIFVGSPLDLYAQTIDSAVSQKKKLKHPRINKNKYSTYFKQTHLETINYITMGAFQIVPEKTKCIAEISTATDILNAVIDLTNVKSAKDTTSRIVENNTPNKEPMPKNEPYQKLEFILPDSIRIKKVVDTKA